MEVSHSRVLSHGDCPVAHYFLRKFLYSLVLGFAARQSPFIYLKIAAYIFLSGRQCCVVMGVYDEETRQRLRAKRALHDEKEKQML